MKLLGVRYFVAVAEELNFTRAAEKLHLAQSALSRQIQQLENELGVALFTRNKRQIRLTVAGRAFLEEARSLMAHYAVAVQRAREGAIEVLNVGIGFGLGEQVIRVLTRYSRIFPGTQVQPQNISSTLQNAALRQFKIDIGFLRAPVDHEYLDSELILKDPLFVLLPASNPLARYRKVRLRQLAGIPLLLPRRDLSAGVYDRVLDLYKRRHISPTIIHTPHTGPFDEAGCMLVAACKGIYIAGGALAREPVYRKGVKVLRLDEPDANIDVYVAWRSHEKSQDVADFLKIVRDVFRIENAILR